MGFDIPMPLLELLFVREFGRLGPLRVPPLVLPIESVGAGEVDPERWRTMWELALEANAAFPPSPDLLPNGDVDAGVRVRQYALSVGIDVEDLRAWCPQVRMDLTMRIVQSPEIYDVEASVPEVADRTIVVLPVAGELLEPLGPQRVLVGEALRFDIPRYRQRLAEVAWDDWS